MDFLRHELRRFTSLKENSQIEEPTGACWRTKYKNRTLTTVGF